MEQDITVEQARSILNGEYDAYGSVRMYFIYGDDSQFVGQIGVVKSEYHLDQAMAEGFSRLYTVTRNGIPIRKA